ncbi:proline-rich protein 5-like isoform X4 [Oryzias latipes]
MCATSLFSREPPEQTAAGHRLVLQPDRPVAAKSVSGRGRKGGERAGRRLQPGQRDPAEEGRCQCNLEQHPRCRDLRFPKEGAGRKRTLHAERRCKLLKTELGSFFTEYLQNQLLTKGMVILRDKIHFYEGQKLLDSLAEIWDFFFCDVLSMLQAIFYPVQGKEPSVRQLALLHFRNIIALNLKLDEALSRPRARVPPSIIQMLLILQGVHESKGVTEDYLRLEALIQKVISPYLGTHGLFSRDGSSNLHCSSCWLEKSLRPSFCPKAGNSPTVKNPVVRSKSYNVPMLSPLVEYDPDTSTGSATSIRRHSVCEMPSCVEESSPLAKIIARKLDQSSTPSLASLSPASTTSAALSDTQTSNQDLQTPSSPTVLHLLQTQHPSPSILPSASSEDSRCTDSPEFDSPSSSKLLAQDTSSGPSPASSPEIAVDHSTASLDSEQEHDGIFLDFSRHRGGDSSHSRDSSQQSVC